MRRLELAERVIELRERAGLTQGEGAKKAGIGVTTWSNIETGTITRPHARTVIKIARALGVDPEELTAPKASALPSPEPEEVPEEERRALSIQEASAPPARFSELPGLMAARERRGISRNELAALSSMSSADIADLEEGMQEAGPEVLDSLTAALGATPGELGFPPEQYAAHLEADERDNERIRRELAELDPSELRSLVMQALLKSRGGRKVSDAVSESLKQRARERPEAG